MASIQPVPNGPTTMIHMEREGTRNVNTALNEPTRSTIVTSTTMSPHSWELQYQPALGTYTISDGDAQNPRYWTYKIGNFRVTVEPAVSPGINTQAWAIRRHFEKAGENDGRGYSVTPVAAPDRILGHNGPNGNVIGAPTTPDTNPGSANLWALNGKS